MASTEMRTALVAQPAAEQDSNVQRQSSSGPGSLRKVFRLFSLGCQQRTQIEKSQEEWQATKEVIGDRAMTGGESVMANTLFRLAALHERAHAKMRDRCTFYHAVFSCSISVSAALAAALVSLSSFQVLPLMATCCSLIAAISHAIANYQQFPKIAQEHHAAANRFLHVTNAAQKLFLTSKIREPRVLIGQLRELYMAALGSAPMVSLSVQAREDKQDVVKLIAQDVSPLPGQAVAPLTQRRVAKVHEMFSIARKNRELCCRRALRFQFLDCALGTSNAALLVTSTSMMLVSSSCIFTTGSANAAFGLAAALLSGLVSCTAAAQNMLQPNKKSAQYHVAQIEFVSIERQLEEALFCSPHVNPDTYYNDLVQRNLSQINTMKKEGLCCVDPNRRSNLIDDSTDANDASSDIESVSPMSFVDDDIESLFQDVARRQSSENQ